MLWVLALKECVLTIIAAEINKDNDMVFVRVTRKEERPTLAAADFIRRL